METTVPATTPEDAPRVSLLERLETVLGTVPDRRIIAEGMIGTYLGRGRWQYETYENAEHKRQMRLMSEHVAALRQALSPLLGLHPVEIELTVPVDYDDKEAVVRLGLPDHWQGTTDMKTAVTGLIGRRLRGNWTATWHQDVHPAYAEIGRVVERAKPPRFVDWEPSEDPYQVFIGYTGDGPKFVSTQTQTPHWGVAGGTGSGKSSTLLSPIVHGRRHGALIDIIDLKEDSFEKSVMGVSGVRVHTTAVSAVACMAEFFTSIKAVNTARNNGYDMSTVPARILVIDEFGSFMLAARNWFKYGLKKKGTPPFEGWWHMILMQGRTKNHRVVVGAHQFSLEMFRSTDIRDLIGTKIVVGPCSIPKWIVSFGVSAKRFVYDGSIPGRGVVGITGQDDNVEEIQVAYLTDDDARALCVETEPAPEWFDRGEMAPWITEEAISLADDEGDVEDFLPGIGAHVTRSHTPPPQGPDRPGSGVKLTDVSWTAPKLYTLKAAAEDQIVPLSYDSLRRYRSTDQGFPSGDDQGRQGGSLVYTADTLRSWYENRQQVKAQG